MASIFELVGLLLAEILDPRAEVAGDGVLAHRRFQHRILDAIEFKAEEQEVASHVGDRRARVGEELAIGRIGHVGIVGEAGIGTDAADQVLERLKLAERRAETFVAGFRAGIGEIALPALLERGRILLRLFEIADEGGAVARGIEVAEIPFRQVAESLAQFLCAGFWRLAGDGAGEGIVHGRTSHGLESTPL
jgi:hypothetical protein